MSNPYLTNDAFNGHMGERIRMYRIQQGMTQVVLAEAARMNQGYLSEIERGRRRPSATALKAIAVALDVPPAVLIGQGADHDTPQPLDTRELPVLGAIPAGPPTDTQEQLEMFPVLRHLWAPDRYVLRLTYDSMEPTLKPGDLVLVEYRPGVNPVHVQGRICACLIDGEATLKRVTVEKRDTHLLIILRGDNPEVPPMVFDESHDFSIQGVVTHLVGRNL